MSTKGPTNPGFEFEGPMGKFWDVKEVPIASLISAIAECLRELASRGLTEAEVLAEVAKGTAE